jgi:hypothetical protein
LQPEVLGAGEAVVALLQEPAMLVLADLVHRLVKVFGDMELIADDACLQRGLLDRRDTLVAHVHRDRLHAAALFFRQSGPELERAFQTAILGHLQHTSLHPFFAGFTSSLAFPYSVISIARLKKYQIMPPLFGLSSFL